MVDIRDDPSLYAASMGIRLPKRIIKSRSEAMIKNFECADKIILTSMSYHNLYSKKYNGKYDDKFLIIPNATDVDRLRMSPLPNKPKVGFIGGMTKGDGVDLLLEAVVLESEVLELKAHHEGPAHGLVLDSTIEKDANPV